MGARKSSQPKSPADDVSHSTGRFAYEGLDRVIHEKARLGIMTSLVAHPSGLYFADLKDLCSLTDGNLNRHLHVLQEAGLIEIWKGTHRNRPLTMCRLTVDGRARFLQYVSALEKVVTDAARNARPHAAARRSDLRGWSPA